MDDEFNYFQNTYFNKNFFFLLLSPIPKTIRFFPSKNIYRTFFTIVIRARNRSIGLFITSGREDRPRDFTRWTNFCFCSIKYSSFKSSSTRLRQLCISLFTSSSHSLFIPIIHILNIQILHF